MWITKLCAWYNTNSLLISYFLDFAVVDLVLLEVSWRPKHLAITLQENLLQNKNYPKSKIGKPYKERINTLAVVAILVVSVTFSCIFTMPDDFTNKKLVEGLASVFCLLIISNTISMLTAMLALVALIWALVINDIN